MSEVKPETNKNLQRSKSSLGQYWRRTKPQHAPQQYHTLNRLSNSLEDIKNDQIIDELKGTESFLRRRNAIANVRPAARDTADINGRRGLLSFHGFISRDKHQRDQAQQAMIVSSVYCWLAQLRCKTDNYDCTTLEQRKFYADIVKYPLIKRVHSLDNLWRPCLQKTMYFENESIDGANVTDVQSTQNRLEDNEDVGCIDEAFAFLNDESTLLTKAKSLTTLTTNDDDDDVDDEIEVMLRPKRHTVAALPNRNAAFMDDMILNESRVSCHSSYLNLWECRSLPQIKHGSVSHCSVQFDECVDALLEEDDVRVVEATYCDVGSSVLYWMAHLLCEDEADNDMEVSTYNVTKVNKFPVSADNVTTIQDKTKMDTQKLRDQIVDNCTKVVLNGSKMKIGSDESVCLQNANLIIKDSKGNLKRTVIENVVEWDESNNKEIVAKGANNAKVKLYTERVHSPIGKNRTFLQLFFRKRISREDLERKGIYKDEPIFGNTLEHLFKSSKKSVPDFVTRVIEYLEEPKNIVSPGLYRTSGNAAVIQSIRFNVDSNRLDVLDTYKEDPDVLAGSLKMFFRELKTSLIGPKEFEKLAKIYKSNLSDSEMFRAIGNEIGAMSTPYKDTLRMLSEHLLKVSKYESENQMNVKSLSICWGPSVISFVTDHNLKNGMLEMIQTKNAILELILLTFHSTFRPNIFEPDSLMSLQNEENAVPLTPINHKAMSALNLTRIDSKQTLLTENVYDMIRNLVRHIDMKGEVRDIYKKPAHTKSVRKILKKTKKTNSKSLHLLIDKANVYDLCGVLKEYIKDMELSIIPPFILEKLISYDGMDNLSDAQELEIWNALHTAPNLQYRTIELLFMHFQRIIDLSSHDPVTTTYNICRAWLIVFYKNNFNLNILKAAWTIEKLINLFNKFIKVRVKDKVYSSGVTTAHFLENINEESCYHNNSETCNQFFEDINCLTTQPRQQTLPYVRGNYY